MAETDTERSHPAAGDAADGAGTQSMLDAVQFNALRNAFYHGARQRFFEWFHRTLMFMIVLTGTAGAASFLSFLGGERVLAFATALLASADLVLDLRGRAQLHDALKRRYYGILAEIEEKLEPTPDDIARWQGQLMRISTEEPVTNRTVNAIAHNEAADSLGRDRAFKLKISPRQYLLRHWTAAQGQNYPYLQPAGVVPEAPRP